MTLIRRLSASRNLLILGWNWATHCWPTGHDQAAGSGRLGRENALRQGIHGGRAFNLGLRLGRKARPGIPESESRGPAAKVLEDIRKQGSARRSPANYIRSTPFTLSATSRRSPSFGLPRISPNRPETEWLRIFSGLYSPITYHSATIV